MDPWNIIGWLILFVAVLFVVVPLSVFVVGIVGHAFGRNP